MASLEQIITGRKGLDPTLFSYKAGPSHYGLDMNISSELHINEAEMSVWLPFASGEHRDGVGDLLEVGGIDTSRHQKNPLALFDHGKTVSLPIGMMEDPKTGNYTVHIDPIAKVAKGKTFFYQGDGKGSIARPREKDHALFCEQLFDLIAKRFVRGSSIGYQVQSAKQLYPDYQQGIPQGMHLLKILMLEGSAVVLPANADTIVKALSLPKVCGKRLSPWLVKSLQPYAPARKAQMGWEGKTINHEVAQRGAEERKRNTHSLRTQGNAARTLPIDLGELTEQNLEDTQHELDRLTASHHPEQAKAMKKKRPSPAQMQANKRQLHQEVGEKRKENLDAANNIRQMPKNASGEEGEEEKKLMEGALRGVDEKSLALALTEQLHAIKALNQALSSFMNGGDSGLTAYEKALNEGNRIRYESELSKYTNPSGAPLSVHEATVRRNVAPDQAKRKLTEGGGVTITHPDNTVGYIPGRVVKETIPNENQREKALKPKTAVKKGKKKILPNLMKNTWKKKDLAEPGETGEKGSRNRRLRNDLRAVDYNKVGTRRRIENAVGHHEPNSVRSIPHDQRTPEQSQMLSEEMETPQYLSREREYLDTVGEQYNSEHPSFVYPDTPAELLKNRAERISHGDATARQIAEFAVSPGRTKRGKRKPLSLNTAQPTSTEMRGEKTIEPGDVGEKGSRNRRLRRYIREAMKAPSEEIIDYGAGDLAADNRSREVRNPNNPAYVLPGTNETPAYSQQEVDRNNQDVRDLGDRDSNRVNRIMTGDETAQEIAIDEGRPGRTGRGKKSFDRKKGQKPRPVKKSKKKKSSSYQNRKKDVAELEKQFHSMKQAISRMASRMGKVVS